MSTPKCDFCNGSHWLGDEVEMGPCVCVTPDALAAVETELAKARDATKFADSEAITWREQLTLANKKLGERDTALVEAENSLAAALNALGKYFVSIGWPADPVKIEDPNLADLYNFLNDWLMERGE